MPRIYNRFQGEIHTEEEGWIPYNKYFKAKHGTYTVTQISLFYIDENGITGTEDFSFQRLKESGMKEHMPELRTFKAGRGRKRVADDVRGCSCWYGSKKDIAAYIKQKYADLLNKGYELTWVN
jgi:hypothetical protein